MTTIEATKGGIIISDQSEAAVLEAIADICSRVGPYFATFTSPVRQADNQFVSVGHVILGAGDVTQS